MYDAEQRIAFDICDVCDYPRSDGACRNPVCGGDDAARARFAAGAVRRDQEARELAERQRMYRLSFTPRR